MAEDLRQGTTSASEFFNLIDLDGSGYVVYDECCAAIVGYRHTCTNDYGRLWEFDWRVDYNMDHMVEYQSEWLRAFSH
jgi:hypothetical protein